MFKKQLEVKNCFMLVVGFLFYLLFVLIVGIVSISKPKILRDKIFGCKNGCGKISCVQVLKKIIEKKLCKPIESVGVVSKEKFFNLNLIYAPVYVIDAKKLGSSHLHLYKKAIEIIKQKINFVILDGVITTNNEIVNVVNLKTANLSFEDFSLLNKLNVNKRMVKLKNDLTIDKNDKMIDKNDFVSTAFVDSVGIIKVSRKTNFTLNLPYNCFGFLIKGKRNKISIFNIFGEKIYEISGKFSAKTNYTTIDFCVTTPNSIVVSFNKDDLKEIMQLLSFNLKFDQYNKEINNLKQKAIEELNNNFFTIESELKFFNVENLKDFFKIANLRGKYFNDYLFMITKIFGVSINNGILNVKPNNFIQQSFMISYSLNGEEYNVQYTNQAYDKVKLSRVGHKIGVKEKFVYDF